MRTMRGRTTPRGGRLRAGDVLLGRYTVLSELGEGGMGVVYKCLDSVGGIEVALKCLPPELSRNDAEMEGIRENYGIVAKLHHSAISGLRQLEKDPDFGEYYLVMDLAEGEDLSAILRRRRGAPMPPAEALAILRPLASALDYAHAEKVLHRDVKPGNVKVSWGGASRPGEPQGGGGLPSAAPARPEASPHLSAPRVQLLDFGLAAEVRSSMSRVSMRGHAGTSGTPAYMAPEQWEAMRQSAATDQYALAAMAYQMLAGYLPFDADDTDLLRRAVLSRPPQPVKGLPGAANAALVRALAKAPEARFPSCTAFVEALARAFEPRGVRRRFRLALAAVLLAGVAAAGVFFTQSRRAAEGGASRPGEPQGGGGLPSAVTARPEASPHLALPPDGEAGGASRPGEPQGGGGLPSAVGANGGLETAAPLADTDDPVASISAPSAVTARPEASPHLALPPDGASVAELRDARTAALDALDVRRERFEPDDSPESAALLAAVSALDARIASALEAEETAARMEEKDRIAARAADARAVAQIARLQAAAIRQERAVSAHRKWKDGEFKTQFDALDKAKTALDALSEANDLPAAEKHSATITAAVAWIEENAAAREEIDAVERSIDAMKTDLASAEAEKYAKAKLGAAETARSDVDRLLARSRYAEAKTKCDEAKLLYDEALSSASAERAAAKAAEAVALAEAAKIREDWDAVLVQSKEALRYEPQNASALALKREAEAENMKIAEAKAEAERKAAQGGASRPGEPQGGGGLQSAVAERKAAQGGASRPGEPQRGGGLPSAVAERKAAQGGASRPGEPQGRGGLPSAVGANGGLETAAPLVGRVTDNGHEGVQLWEGGPYWATTNIGADKPEYYGLYFWWGDTVGYRREGDAWVASDGSNRNYSFSKDNSPTYGKSESGLKRSGWLTSTGVLAPVHDAAHVHWGGAWRMPTRGELDALRINCDWTWTTQNGSEGYLVRGRGAYSSASIFLPAAGYGGGTSLRFAGSYGYYWSSVPFESGSYLAWGLCFGSGYRRTYYDCRYYGRSVRPVQGFAK